MIWFFYLLRKVGISFLFIISASFFLYLTIDLSLHGAKLIGKADMISHVLLYYVLNFAKLFPLFFPLSFLLAASKTLFECNERNELIAWQMAGLSKRKILAPFFLFACLLSCLEFFNHEWIIPQAFSPVETFHEQVLQRKGKNKRLYSVSLEAPNKDLSELVYQDFDRAEHRLFDVFWIERSDRIWHCKSILLDTEGPLGQFVDCFQRDENGGFQKIESHESFLFQKLVIEPNCLQESIPPEFRPLSRLMQQIFLLQADTHRIEAHLHYKIATSLLPIFLLFFIAPPAMRFQRHLRPFLFISLHLLFFFGFMTILDGMLILGENQVVPPFFAIWSPILLPLFLFFTKKGKTWCIRMYIKPTNIHYAKQDPSL